MKEKKDAYGQEVWAYLNGKDSYEVVEREDGFIALSSGAKSYFAKYKDWPKWQKQAIKFAKGRILDIGCGAGRISFYLQQKGFDVVGIDNSPLAIKVCKKRGLKKVLVRAIGGVDKFKPDSFDTVIMFGNNFGLFGSFKKAKQLLKKLYKITSKDAVIIAESNDPYKTNDTIHLAYHKFNRRRGRMAGQLKIRIRFRTYIGDWFDYLLVSKKEMESILEGTGWKVKKYINSGKHMYIAILHKATLSQRRLID